MDSNLHPHTPSWHDFNQAKGQFSLPLDVRNFVEQCLPIDSGYGGTRRRLSAFLLVLLLCNKNGTTPLMYDNLYPLKWCYSDRRRHFFFTSLYKTTVMGPNAQSDILCSLSPWTRLKRRINGGVRHHAPGAKCALYSIVHLYLIWYLQGLYTKFTSNRLRSLRTRSARLRAI
jgi:hypothetical protein